MTSTPRIYPEPTAHRYLTVDAGHRIAYRSLGLANAADVWLVLHGGPGSGADLGLTQPFDLSRQRVILPDQRGSGASRPRGGTRHNSLPHLVNDLEVLRHHLGIRQWHVLGGSWGATLALAYAATHPASVGRLVLRGAFDGQTSTVRRLFQRFWPDRRSPLGGLGHRAMCHQLFQVLQSRTVGVTQARVLSHWQRMELDAALAGAQRAMRAATHSKEGLAAHAHWQALHRQRRQLMAGATTQRPWLAVHPKYRIQAHYLARGCGVPPGQWTRWLDRAARAGLRVQWVQGTFDAVCHRRIAEAAHARWRLLAPPNSQLHMIAAGHLGTDPGTLKALGACVHAAPQDLL